MTNIANWKVTIFNGKIMDNPLSMVIFNSYVTMFNCQRVITGASMYPDQEGIIFSESAGCCLVSLQLLFQDILSINHFLEPRRERIRFCGR